VLLLVWLGGWALGQVEWVEPRGAPLRIALVQGNVPLSQKWQPEYRQTIVDRYVHLSEQAGKVDLIVWPEAALPGFLEQFGPGLMARLESLSRAQGAELVLGVVERGGAKREYYNSVLRVGATPAWYRKQHLVPFGEFLPWPSVFRGLIRYLQIPMSDFAAGGAAQAPFVAAGHTLGISVCYEDAFGEEVIRALPAATLLVNVSEDAWFGHSLAPHQRIQMARLRALESGRPLVRAANTGPSVAIDHIGRIAARSPQFEPHTLVVTVQPMQGVTPYARGGNAPVVLAAALLFGVAFIVRWRRRRRRPVHIETVP
jgi:apolipoprotein N-acyltransferase